MRVYRGAGSLRSLQRHLPALLGLLASAGACAQIALVATVHTVTAAGQPPAVEHDFTVQNAGTYSVTVADLGAKLSPAAPLSSVALAVTQGTAIVGTPSSVTAAGSPITLNAAANTRYTIHVVGTPGSTLGSGPIEEDVTDSGGNRIFSSVDNLTVATQQPSGVGFVDDSFTVSSGNACAAGPCTVTMTDLQFPAALQTASPNNPQLLLVDSTTGTMVASLTAFGSTQTPSALSPGDTYDILAVVQQGSNDGGLFSVSVGVPGSTAAYGPRIVPVGEVALLQSSASGQTQSSFTLTAATSTTLALKDLAFPSVALTAVGAALVDETSQQPVAMVTGSTQQTITTPSSTDTYQVFAYAVPDDTVNSGGSYSITVQQGSSFAFDEAEAVPSMSSSGVTVQAFSLDTSVASAAPYVFTLTDFKFPAALTTTALAAVQNGQLLGSINAAGNFTENVSQGPVTLLAFAEEGSAGQAAGSSPGLLGVDLSPKGGGAAVFDVTEGIGAGFSSTSFTAQNAQPVQANVADLKFPAALQNLNLAVTSGTTLVGSIVSAGSSGSFPFSASANTTYNLNVIAQPATGSQGTSQKYEAGTYAMSVDPAPTVTLSASSATVASGGTVSLSWTAANATSCTASASPANSAWNGDESPTGGPVTSSAIAATTTFSLSCTGGGGSATSSATVTLDAPPGSGKGGGGGGALDVGTLLALAAVAALRWRDSRSKLRPMTSVRAAALAFLILPVILLTGCTGADARRQSYIERGQTYFDQGDYNRASIEFRNAMQVSPKDPRARLLAGEAAERLGRYRDAAGLFQSVVESNPDNVQARVDLGQIFDFGGVPKRALELIQPALARHPNDPGLLTVSALARSQLNDYVGAVSDAKHAVQADPTYEQAVGLLAGLYRQKGDNADAAALVGASLKRMPHSTELREVLASIYEQAGDATEAEAQLDQLIAARPSVLQYRSQLAQLYVREGKPDEAEGTLRAAVKAAPDSDDAKLALADFMAGHRSPARGETTLQSFIDGDPDDLRLRLALGALLERSGQAQQALRAYDEIIRRSDEGPDALAARDRIAAIDASQGRNDAAADEVAKVLAKDPGNDAALMIRGNLDLAAGHPTAAVTDLRAVLRDQPGLIAVHDLLARALLASGDTALAEDQLQQAIQIAPADAATRMELAQIYTRAHDLDRATTILEQGVQQLPTDGPLREALVRAYIAKGDFKSASAQAGSMTAALPHSGAGPYLEGLIALAQKHYVPAESDFEEALVRQPRAMAPLLDLTRLELSHHEDAKAAKRLQAMVLSDPKDGLALELLGELNLAQKAYPQAIDAFSRAVGAAPSLWFAYRNLAVARMATGDTAGAIAAYEAGIKAVPDRRELVTELASCYVVQGQSDGAIALYESLYRSEPQSPAIASNLALLLATYKTDRQSLDRARQLTAAFASSRDGALLDSNGWVLLKTGDLQHALPELRRAEGQNPASNLFHYHLAIAELQAGQRARAQADLKAALSGAAAFPGAADARSKLANLESGA